MASITLTNRNGLIAGLVILLVLVGVILYSLFHFGTQRPGQPQVGHRSPIDALTYCGVEQNKLCIISFSQNVDGGMQINFQTPFAFYPEFIVKITHNEEEITYECERVEATSTAFVCTGKPQVPGEVMEFKVFSKNWGNLLAEGRFAIIGIALLTPVGESTATMAGFGTGTPLETLTVTPPFDTPTPMPTALTPSYPNPSYP
jgi:hypothetical protein